MHMHTKWVMLLWQLIRPRVSKRVNKLKAKGSPEPEKWERGVDLMRIGRLRTQELLRSISVNEKKSPMIQPRNVRQKEFSPPWVGQALPG